MNKLVIPPSANWYETSILACAPDNTLIYGARNDIVVIYDVPNDQPADIRIIPRAHSQKIVSTSINKNWGNPHKLLVTVAEDNIIKLWDIETRKKKLGHNGHAGHGKIIGATFAGDDRVISVSEGGIIVVWNVTLNQINTLKDIFGLKVTITCISTCPHATWLTAFGLKNGLVVVTDLRKQGKVLYKLRGHDKSVLSLSWCPAPVNIFPIDPQNSVGAKSNPDHLTENSSSVDKSETCNDSLSLNIQNDNRNVTENTNDMNHKPTISDVITENKQTKKTNKIWTDLKFNDDEDPEVLTESRETTTAELDNSINDFLKECEDLKEKIRKDPAVTDESNNRVEDNIEGDRVIVKAKRKRRKSLKGKKHNLKISNEQTPEIGKSDEGHGNSSNADTSVNIVVEDFVIYSDNNDNKVLDAGIEVETNVLSQDELTSKLEEQDILLHNEKTRLYFSETNTESCINTAVKETSIDSTNVLKDSEEVKQEYIASPVTSADKDAIELSPVKDAIKENSLEEKYSLDDLGKIEVPEIAGEDTKIGSNEQTVKEGVEEIGCEGEKQVQVKEIIKEEPRREFLLASSGKDGNIYIWRAGTDGRMQTFLSIPKPIYHRSHRSNFDKLWIVVCWISPTVLLSSSKAAELIKWTLPKPKDKNKQYSIIHNDHNSILFSIAAPVVLLNDYNWLDQRKLNVWTFGHDRVLLNTSLSSERKNLAYYPTLGNAECFASSPLDPNRLAIGTAEGTIKVWDLSRPNIKHIIMTNFFQKIQSKVVTMAWHPTQELILAYGTVEGRVGVMDSSNKSRTPTLAHNFFKSQIHKVEWGPLNGNEEDLGLYVVAEGKLVVYNTKILTRAPSEVDTPDDTFVYTFAWKPDYTILLVGTKTGSVILYSKDLKILSTNYFQHKLKEICWHPDSVQSDLGTSKYCYWFAAVSNSKDVTICNFQTDVNDGNNIVTKYERSEDVINCIAWSPYASNQLVIASDEGTAQVWDVEADVIISTYVSPNFEGISAVIWSPTSSDLIISAAKDHTIRVWSILEHPKQDENEIKHLRKKVIKEIMNEQTDLLPKGENVNEEQTETPKNKKVAKVNILPIFYYPKETVQVIDDLKKLLLWKEGLFTEEPDNTDSGSEILKIFGSKHDMLNIMERNDSLHQQKGKYSLSNTLSLFKGDINTKIKKAIEDKRVNPWVIMMSPMVSIKTWQSACETYAQQLSEEADSDALEIASYYLACHKVEQAIDILCEAAMFREALALAKCRLAEDNSAVTNIIEKWAKQTVVVGNFEAAALCFIYLGKYEDAASVLFRRSDATTLKFAAELSEKSGNEELHKAILLKYNLIKHDVEEKDIELPTKLDAFLKKQKENILCEEKTTISTKSVFLDNQNVEIIHYEGDDAEIETKDKEQDRLLENDNKSAYISENDLLEKNMSDTPDVKLSESHTSLDNENTV